MPPTKHEQTYSASVSQRLLHLTILALLAGDVEVNPGPLPLNAANQFLQVPLLQQLGCPPQLIWLTPLQTVSTSVAATPLQLLLIWTVLHPGVVDWWLPFVRLTATHPSALHRVLATLQLEANNWLLAPASTIIATGHLAGRHPGLHIQPLVANSRLPHPGLHLAVSPAATATVFTSPRGWLLPPTVAYAAAAQPVGRGPGFITRQLEARHTCSSPPDSINTAETAHLVGRRPGSNTCRSSPDSIGAAGTLVAPGAAAARTTDPRQETTFQWVKATSRAPLPNSSSPAATRTKFRNPVLKKFRSLKIFNTLNHARTIWAQHLRKGGWLGDT